MKPSRHYRTSIASLLPLLLVCPATPALPQAQPVGPTLRAESMEVLVDVVIRDKKGRLLHGLGPSDIVIREDGVVQPITAIREVSIAPNTPSSESPAPPKPGESRVAVREPVQMSKQIRLVSLVYDRLGPDGRRLSRQASLQFLDKDLGPNTYYGVFTIDRSFRVLQAYTNDRALLRLAVQKATSGERSNFSSDSQGLEAMSAATSGSGGAADALSAASQGGRGSGAVDGAALSNEEANRMAKEMSDLSEMVNREELGRMSVFSLWAIIKELQKLPGRKMALYFAEGLQMPTGLVEQYKSMLGDANRANVSIYAIDARGLMTSSDQSAANAKLAEAAQWSRYARTTQQETAAGNKQEFRSFDRAVDSLRANQQYAMVELAESTGGFLIANTNDLRPHLDRLSEDFRTYYEISYRPLNQAIDGRFRAISVKVNRSDAVVQARDGYFALPQIEGQTVFSYEAPLLRALSQTPLPHSLNFHSRVLQFRQYAGLQHSMLVFDLPMTDVAFSRDEKAGKYRTHISVLALVKDEQGRVVSKLSRDVPLNEPLDRLSGFKQGRFIATRIVNLPPGRYTLESVAADFEGNQLGARKSVLVIPPSSARLGLSEICLIRRMDRLPEVRDVTDPFQLARGRVIPSLADTVASGSGRMLSLFFTIYPDETAPDKPKLVLDLLRDGKILTRSTPDLPPVEISGAVPFVANTPMDNLKPGQYEFRATLIQGEAAAQRSFYVNLE